MAEEKCNKDTGEIEMPENKLSKYNERGEELPDSKPVALPVGFKRPIPLGDRIRSLVQNELFQRELASKGIETFEDADDFEVADDPIDRTTPYEETFDPLHTTCREQEIKGGFVEERPLELKKKAREKLDAYLREKAEAQKKPEPDESASSKK